MYFVLLCVIICVMKFGDILQSDLVPYRTWICICSGCHKYIYDGSDVFHTIYMYKECQTKTWISGSFTTSDT